MAEYIGLTIGPIYKTLHRAKKTRELWGASYFFSYLMKKIILEMKTKYKADFVIPYVKAPDIFNPGKEVGLFHDRLIARVKGSVFDTLYEDVICPILYETAGKIIEKLGSSIDQDLIYDYLKSYLNIYFCRIESDKAQKDINKEINQHLDVLELQGKFIHKDQEDFLMRFLNCVNKSFLIEDAFKQRRHSFQSIPEIASRELLEGLVESGQIVLTPSASNPEDTDDTVIYKQIKTLRKDAFKTYHKYIAIVQADGDDLGKAIAGLDSKGTDAFEQFSKALFRFAQKAHDIIKINGGATIYAGGDDLLFFAPVMYKGKTVFDVCHCLGDCFKENIAEGMGREEDLPTLSFGISISYYKYPMYEALESAQTQLFSKAKKFPGKNAIAFQYLKNSGNFFNGTLSRNSDIYPHFRNLIKNDPQYDLKTEILTSVIRHILNFRTILLEIGQDHEKLAHFFDNTFNEDIHGPYSGFFTSVCAFLHEVCCTCKYDPDEKIKLIYNVLKLKKNLKGEEDK